MRLEGKVAIISGAARGIVKEIRVRNATVDMGRSGTWHIPFYFLTLPQAA